MRPIYFWLMLFSVILPSYITGFTYFVKLKYVDEIPHFKESMCKINNCTSYMSTCCGNGIRINSCSVCYNVLLKYELFLDNKNITKNGSGVVASKDLCSWESIYCYYDNRDLENSLRLWTPYEIKHNIMFGIVMLSFLLSLLLVIAIGIICYTYKIRNSEYESVDGSIN